MWKNGKSVTSVLRRNTRQGWLIRATRCAYSTGERTWSTPLAKDLAEAITTTGPISIASFMRQCLTSAEHGYYATSDANAKAPIGRGGDFVTSPEISQIFGELVGIWFVAEWMSQGKQASGVELVELGPGKGTLMDDILRTIAQFKPMASAVESIWLVESSPTLRELQKKLLCGDEATMEETAVGFKCQSKRLPGVTISWVEDLSFKPKDSFKAPFFVAHEFFDALPIYSFQSAPLSNTHRPKPQGITTSTSPLQPPAPPPPVTPSLPRLTEWRELLVNITAPPSVINPPKEPKPEFELTLSNQPTRHSRILPMISNRYKKLLNEPNATIEICPSACIITGNIAEAIGGPSNNILYSYPKDLLEYSQQPPTTTSSSSSNSPSASTSNQPSKSSSKPTTPKGAALIIDYGPPTTVPTNTLRGIKSHKTVSPFAEPGRVDISADVDFAALAESALKASQEVEVHGPVAQGDWLAAMGGKERMEMLLKGAEKQQSSNGSNGSGNGDGEPDLVERIRKGWERLVDRGPDGMGKVYKVMSIVPASTGVSSVRRPVGFGGDVSG